MNIKEILNQSEGRRLEFKAELPEHSDLAKTVVAFANDAGGDLYIGVADDPREVVGLDEDKLVQSKELIMKAPVPYIVARGRKGGSNIAACICNALLYMINNER